MPACLILKGRLILSLEKKILHTPELGLGAIKTPSNHYPHYRL
jgi:hypothetical protein